MPGTGRSQESNALASALTKRDALGLGDTDAFRVFDGLGDGIAGVEIDAFGDVWVISTRSEPPSPALVQAAREHCRSIYWKRLDRENKEAPQHLWGTRVEVPFRVRESGLIYEIDLTSGYSQGIFLDQRTNRLEVRRRVEKAPQAAVLNLFSYTCAFSVAAAAGGATTTSLDLSRNYLEWGKRNLSANGISIDGHFFCKGDAFDWLGRWRRAGRRFGGVVCDPPTFSRGSRGTVFRVEKDYARLAAAVGGVLEPGGWALFCTNFRGANPDGFRRAVEDGLRDAGVRAAPVTSTAMPPEFTGEQYLHSVWARC